MPIRWRGEPFARFSDSLKNAASDMPEVVEENMRNLAKFGWATTKRFVETRGVESNPNPGRIRTGDMRDALDWDTYREGSVVFARAGWINSPAPYTLFQEEGTDGPGRGIEAMHALADAYILTRQELQGRGMM